jgi:hypothetical protein
MHLFIRADAAAVKKVADKIRAADQRRRTPPSPAPRSIPAELARATIRNSLTIPPLPAIMTAPREDAMLIKSQPDKSKPIYVTGLLSGPMFVGLGPTETPSDEQARQAGIPVLWVEYGTWQELDRRSHALCDNPRPVVTQSPVVRTAPTQLYPATGANRSAYVTNMPEVGRPESSATRPPSENSRTVEPTAPSSPNSPSPSA